MVRPRIIDNDDEKLLIKIDEIDPKSTGRSWLRSNSSFCLTKTMKLPHADGSTRPNTSSTGINIPRSKTPNGN